jgi:hypothetical protein
LGFLLGTLLPKTRVETERMGEVSDRANEAAKGGSTAPLGISRAYVPLHRAFATEIPEARVVAGLRSPSTDAVRRVG